jgi:hypothetical protein
VLAHYSPLQGHVGAPDPTWFQIAQTSRPERAADIVWRTDFLWELTNLPSRKKNCGDNSKKP